MEGYSWRLYQDICINEYIYLIKFLNYHALMFFVHRLNVCLPAKKEMGMQLHVDLEATARFGVSLTSSANRLLYNLGTLSYCNYREISTSPLLIPLLSI